MKTPLDPRHVRREKIVQELFAWNMHPDKSDRDEKTKKIIKEAEAVDKIILESAPEWEIDKLNGVDLAILRLAIYELIFEGTEPAKVVVDEAIELGKEFGGENSPAFVNGALGKVMTSRKRILTIISVKLGVEAEKLLPEANFYRDLNATNLEVADLLAALEKEYHLTIPKNFRPTTVGEIVEFVEDQNE